jgi:hypothetical protein
VKKSDRDGDGDDSFSDVKGKAFRNAMRAYGTELEKEKVNKNTVYEVFAGSIAV